MPQLGCCRSSHGAHALERRKITRRGSSGRRRGGHGMEDKDVCCKALEDYDPAHYHHVPELVSTLKGKGKV